MFFFQRDNPDQFVNVLSAARVTFTDQAGSGGTVQTVAAIVWDQSELILVGAEADRFKAYFEELKSMTLAPARPRRKGFWNYVTGY